MYNYIVNKQKTNHRKLRTSTVGSYLPFKKDGKNTYYAKDGKIRMCYIEDGDNYFVLCKYLYYEQKDYNKMDYIKENLRLRIDNLFFSLSTEDKRFKQLSKNV